MNAIQQEYRTRKHISWVLIATLLGIILVFRYISPEGQHAATALEMVLLGVAVLIVIGMYLVLRCPKCRASLVRAYSGFWPKVEFCPECGEKLAEP
jgi:hypothetical protein